VGPDVRTAVIIGGLVFWGFFALMTLTVVLENGIDVLSVAAIVILALLAPPLFGSLKGPPK
jgi:hypothetical protein